VSCGGLHIGKVFYGNIGSNERLDFTLVAPSVNEVARITATCRSTERDVPLSEVFADATGTHPSHAAISSPR
jgi:adenylate cyclase